ncbi:anti-sigma factor family protein [Paenibacillus sp. 481]|uniref:anti-sigma factor family protein n=1 Tax=Paenibacillus sp. 481 TaxID=2835869 RepID=UPI001E55A00F|nr:hypothetical protein [Paenibacillus sp. 481]UHA72976.1 hypothetical protein KIK04_20585 [Paenibacillus sp. 481]
MKCAETLDCISMYEDMPIDDPQRQVIEEHLSGCQACAEMYAVWAASEQWEDELTSEPEWSASSPFQSNHVMERIFKEEDWLVPVHQRSQTFSLRSRKMLSGLIAFCLTIFLSSLTVLLVRSEQSNMEHLSGMIPTSVAGVGEGWESVSINVPVAGVSEPVLLQVVPAVPHYWIALSLFGVTFALMLLNWLTRVRH